MSVTEINIEIEVAEAAIAKAQRLKELQTNPAFKEIIIDGYLKEEAVRLVHLKADPTQQDDESQKIIDTQIQGIGCLSQYFQVIDMQAAVSEKAIHEARDALSEEMAE